MTDEERKRRSEDTNVNFIKNNICDHKGNKSYVFISYKSDDWEIVLHDIVYRLERDYGLNVYFDGSFDKHNGLWITQFPENMKSYKCKGVIAFFDDKYATSYATLLELMYSQTKKAENGKKDSKRDGLPIVPIDLGTLTDITGEKGEKNTGLGVETYDDGSVNVNAKNELESFTKAYNELVKRKILNDFYWDEGEDLSARSCSLLVRELKAYRKINENYYEEGGSLDSIVETIKDACGEDVFSSIKMNDENSLFIPKAETKTVIENSNESPEKSNMKKDDTIEENSADNAVYHDQTTGGLINERGSDTCEKDDGEENGIVITPLKTFLEKYSNDSFKASAYDKIRLVGKGNYKKYSTEFEKNIIDVAFKFVCILLNEKGENLIDDVNELHKERKNPLFVTEKERSMMDKNLKAKYKKFPFEGYKDYYMFVSYLSYDGVRYLIRDRMTDCGLSIENFDLEYKTPSVKS